MGFTPYRADFFDYVEVDIAVKDVTRINKAIGIGTVIYKFVNDRGEDVFSLVLLTIFSLQTFGSSVLRLIITYMEGVVLWTRIR